MKADTLVGFIIGLMAGVIVGFLLAPRAGDSAFAEGARQTPTMNNLG